MTEETSSAKTEELQEKEMNNKFGIPGFNFPELATQNTQDWCKHMKKDNIQDAMKTVQEIQSKYNFYLNNQQRKRENSEHRLKELKSNLQILERLETASDEGESLETTFKLSEPLYMKAKLNCEGSVYLWLGANVMCEYKISEAKSLLTKNVQTVTVQIKSLGEEVDFVREQLTLVEMARAMIYNSIIEEKSRKKAEQAKAGMKP